MSWSPQGWVPQKKNQGRQFKLSALVAFRTGGPHQKIPHKGFCSSFGSASSRATSSTEESIIANRRPLVNFTSGKTSTVCTVSRPIRNSGKNLMNFHRSRYHNTSLYASDFFFSDFLIAGLFDAGGEISDVSVSGSRRLFSRDLPAEVPSVPIQEVPWRG